MARRYVPHQFDLLSANGIPPRGIDRTSGVGKSPDGLTPKFNSAAKKKEANVKHSVPVSKGQIEKLKAKLSRPAHTHEMTPMGNVIGSYAPNRDLKIRHTIKAMQAALSKRQDMARKAFAEAQLKNKAKQSFNRSSGFRM